MTFVTLKPFGFFLEDLGGNLGGMPGDASVQSFPSRTWSCGTLAEGVAACAQIAGISLRPEDADQDPLKAM